MNDLHKKIQQIEYKELVNKKYLVPAGIDLQLQQFCLKNQLKQSEVLALAISELLKKYEDGEDVQWLLS